MSLEGLVIIQFVPPISMVNSGFMVFRVWAYPPKWRLSVHCWSRLSVKGLEGSSGVVL